MPKREWPRPKGEGPRFLRGFWMSSKQAKIVCLTVACPRCKAAKTWPCFSVNGIETSTPHSARWEAYQREVESPSGKSPQAGSTD